MPSRSRTDPLGVLVIALICAIVLILALVIAEAQTPTPMPTPRFAVAKTPTPRPTPQPALMKVGTLPTRTVLPCEMWQESWHQGPTADGRTIGFNDFGDHVVIRECHYEGPQLICTDWVTVRQSQWRWLRREVGRATGW